MKDSKSKIISGILILIIIFLIAALVYFILQNNKLEKEIINNTTTTETSVKSNDINNTTSTITTTTKDISSSNQEKSVSIKQALVMRDVGSFIYELCNDSKSSPMTAYNNSYKLSFKYLSTEKTEENEELCSIIVDDKLNFTFGYITQNAIHIIKTDKYYIVESEFGAVEQYSFIIYDINGKKVYSEDSCTNAFGYSYVENGRYYYNCYDEIDDQHDRLFHKSIDLNKDTIISKDDSNGYIIDKLPQAS